MNFLTKIKTSTIKVGQKITTAIASAIMTINTLAVTAFADGEDTVSVNTDIDTENLIGNIVSVILSVFQWIGILLLVWGIGQLVMAFKNEDADSKSRAMMMIVSSVLLIGLKALLVTIGIIAP